MSQPKLSSEPFPELQPSASFRPPLLPLPVFPSPHPPLPSILLLSSFQRLSILHQPPPLRPASPPPSPRFRIQPSHPPPTPFTRRQCSQASSPPVFASGQDRRQFLSARPGRAGGDCGCFRWRNFPCSS